MFVKIDHVQRYLLRSVYHEAEVPECHVSKKRNIRGARKFFPKSLRKRSYPEVITTDRLVSRGSAFKAISIERRQETGRHLNNHGENFHHSFRRRERAK